jgi:hypothetical protein
VMKALTARFHHQFIMPDSAPPRRPSICQTANGQGTADNRHRALR